MDRTRWNTICYCFILFTCFCYVVANESILDETHSESELDQNESSVIPTAVQTYRNPRTYRRGYQDADEEEEEAMYLEDHQEDDHAMKAMGQGKVDYWGGYYDFLINEGSYKFWAVFQLATAALLIYSGFAALYYAKVNPPTTDDEFDDILRRRRRRDTSNIFPKDKPFCGLDSATFQRIIDAVAKKIH